MENRYLIYALVDPCTYEIRYVGKSTSGMYRPRSHKQPSSLRKKDHKNHWIKKLQSEGKLYEIAVLEYVSDPSKLSAAEIKWISFIRCLGCHRLTNLTDGGEGSLGRNKTPEEIERIKLSNAEAKRKISKEGEAELCLRYQAGRTTYELSEAFGIERHTVSRMLRRNGIELREKTQTSRRKISPASLVELTRLYQEGWTTSRLAERFATYASNILYNLKKLGVKTRTRSEAAVLSNSLKVFENV